MNLFQRVASVLGVAAIAGIAFSAHAAEAPRAAEADGFSIQVDGQSEFEAGAFSLSVGSAKAKVGKQTTLTVTVKAKGAFKGNPNYPHKIKSISGSNVEAPKKVTGSASGKTISFSIPVTPKASGANPLTGKIKFGICDESQCEMKTATLSATVTGT